jgi:hydrogenase expression/formation protein HypC
LDRSLCARRRGGFAMCLALPARVVELRAPDQALVELGGVRKSVSIALVPETRAGDYVIVHVGFAIGRLDPAEAERTLALIAEFSGVDPRAPCDGGEA